MLLFRAPCNQPFATVLLVSLSKEKRKASHAMGQIQMKDGTAQGVAKIRHGSGKLGKLSNNRVG